MKIDHFQASILKAVSVQSMSVPKVQSAVTQWGGRRVAFGRAHSALSELKRFDLVSEENGLWAATEEGAKLAKSYRVPGR